MSSRRGLKVCLCLDDLDSCICGILINELGSGHVFGCDQTLNLELQSSDSLHKLDDLRQEVQDCAFPVIKELACDQTLGNAGLAPDVILVVLANRHFPYTTAAPTAEQFQRLLSLVSYISNLSNKLSMLDLDTVKIIIAGDLALTAASVMSNKLNKLSANQIIAIDFLRKTEPKRGVARGCYKTAKSICETVKQWWSGVQTPALTQLGLKHTDPAWRASRRTCMSQGGGYFFATLVSLTGPMKFVARNGRPVDHDHIAEVKAINDLASSILQEMNERCRENDKEGCNFTLAHL